MKLFSLAAECLVGSMWRRECLAQTLKVCFDRMMATLLHQFDAGSVAHDDQLKAIKIVNSWQRV
jgi:hypothetical protein